MAMEKARVRQPLLIFFCSLPSGGSPSSRGQAVSQLRITMLGTHPILILPLTRKIPRITMFPLRMMHVNRQKITPRVNIMVCCKQPRTPTNCCLWLLRVVASTFNSC